MPSGRIRGLAAGSRVTFWRDRRPASAAAAAARPRPPAARGGAGDHGRAGHRQGGIGGRTVPGPAISVQAGPGAAACRAEQGAGGERAGQHERRGAASAISRCRNGRQTAISAGLGGRPPGGRQGINGVSSRSSRARPTLASMRSSKTPSGPAKGVPLRSSASPGGFADQHQAGYPGRRRRTPGWRRCRAGHSRRTRPAPARSSFKAACLAGGRSGAFGRGAGREAARRRQATRRRWLASGLRQGRR